MPKRADIYNELRDMLKKKHSPRSDDEKLRDKLRKKRTSTLEKELDKAESKLWKKMSQIETWGYASVSPAYIKAEETSNLPTPKTKEAQINRIILINHILNLPSMKKKNLDEYAKQERARISKLIYGEGTKKYISKNQYELFKWGMRSWRIYSHRMDAALRNESDETEKFLFNIMSDKQLVSLEQIEKVFSDMLAFSEKPGTTKLDMGPFLDFYNINMGRSIMKPDFQYDFYVDLLTDELVNKFGMPVIIEDNTDKTPPFYLVDGIRVEQGAPLYNEIQGRY